ncbi:helix-turn-helix domain-containing protein [Limosilactobacillus equigenerosi]
MSQTTVTLWEQGKSKPSLGSAVKLANFYAVDLTVISNAINYHFS